MFMKIVELLDGILGVIEDKIDALSRRQFTGLIVVILAAAGGGYATARAALRKMMPETFIIDRTKGIVAKGTYFEHYLHTPAPEKNFSFVVDCEKCIGCQLCAVACRQEYEVPEGVWRSWVKIIEKKSPAGSREFYLPRLCNHCDTAPCVAVCPTTAAYKREDGFILTDYDKCVGCKYCMTACPYDARFIHPYHKVSDKCTWCDQRVEKGMLPACVEICPADARIFGDANDPNSEVAKILVTTPVQVIKPGLRCTPKTYYIGLDKDIAGMIRYSDEFPEAIEEYPFYREHGGE